MVAVVVLLVWCCWGVWVIDWRVVAFVVVLSSEVFLESGGMLYLSVSLALFSLG